MRNALVVLVAVGACCPSQWRIAADVTSATAVSALACDGGTTDQFLHDSSWMEINPVLGSDPSDLRLWSYLGTIGAGVIASDLLLRAHHPQIALAIAAVVLGIEIESIAVNMHVGAGFCGVGHPGPWEPLPGAATARSP
jgi:hypothetical protein